MPGDLMREVKIRAGHERKKLKGAMAEVLRQQIGAGKTQQAKFPKATKLRCGPLTTAEIEPAIAWGRD